MDIQFEKVIDSGSFVLVCGRTGCGKTTLLNNFKKELGNKAMMVMQNPDNQIVMDRVYDELSFGASNIGMDTKLAKRRVAEIASYFSLSSMFDRKTDSLSGGEKQILNLASAMVMDPDVLLLDEPCSMLDPVMAGRLLDRIKEINKEFNKTIVIVEHKIDELFNYADKIIFMDDMKVEFAGCKEDAAIYMSENGFGELLPATARIFTNVRPIPLSINEAKKHIKPSGKISDKNTLESGEVALSIKNVVFAYEKGRMLIDDLSMELYKGMTHFIVGENGSGKTTLAMIIAGMLKPYSGKVNAKHNKIGMLSQDVTDHFILDEYDGKHPYDLSGGEKQLLAFKLVLQNNPDIVILDEPTKGLDKEEKNGLVNTINKNKKDGKTFLIISHDIEFMAECADFTYMLSNGEMVYSGNSYGFCKDNVFYNTYVSRMWKGISDLVITVNDAKEWNE